MNELQTMPHSHEAELSIISTCILYPKEINIVLERLSYKDFYSPQLSQIFSVCTDLFIRKENIDLVIIKDEIEKRACNIQTTFLSSIINSPVAIDIKHTCKIIKTKAILRTLINATYEIQKECYNNPETALDNAQKTIMGIKQHKEEINTEKLSKLSITAIDRYDELRKRKNDLTGITTGLHALDNITCGLQKTDLILLAARPAMGKTALAINIAVSAAKDDKNVLVFSLEMSKQQLMNRIFASETGLNSYKFKTGKLSCEDDSRVAKAGSILYELPLWINDDGILSYQQIWREALRFESENNRIDLIVIDYLQYIVGDNTQNKNYEIQTITRGLKGIAKSMDIPVLLLSQLNRSCETRANPHKRPIQSDLRDSGAIEQDADMIWFLYRPEVFDEKDEAGNPQTGIAELIIAKQRNGEEGLIKMQWDKKTTTFRNLF